jgi:hypothetical protein
MSDIKQGVVNHRVNWFRSLVKSNLEPEMCIIEEVDDSLQNESEIHWIAYFKSIGCVLTNQTLGGDGGQMSKEARLKMSKAAKCRVVSPKRAAKVSKSLSGRPWSEARRTKQVLAMKGNTNGKGHTLTDTNKAKLIETNTGRVWSKESRDKISIATISRQAKVVASCPTTKI